MADSVFQRKSDPLSDDYSLEDVSDSVSTYASESDYHSSDDSSGYYSDSSDDDIAVFYLTEDENDMVEEDILFEFRQAVFGKCQEK